MSERVDLLGLTIDELAAWLKEIGQPAYRARQLFAWLHRGASFPEMTELPKELRERLEATAQAGTLKAVGQETAKDGAIKFGFRTGDGEIIESVLIPHGERTTVCVSSQIGCAYGCRFCATGKQGLKRSLRAGEIVQQVVCAQREARPRRVSNVVFMGMGEPLANYEAVVKAVRLLNQPGGLGIGARHIAISTCGLPGEIRRLAGEGLPLGLAISLHAATDELRSRLVPINRRHPIAEVMAAAREFAQRTGRKVTFQYVVIPGENDTDDQARHLMALVKGFPSMVNLIPRNPTEGGAPSDLRAALKLAALLKKMKVEVAVRRSRGGEVLGACGQLRSRLEQEKQAGRT